MVNIAELTPIQALKDLMLLAAEFVDNPDYSVGVYFNSGPKAVTVLVYDKKDFERSAPLLQWSGYLDTTPNVKEKILELITLLRTDPSKQLTVWRWKATDRSGDVVLYLSKPEINAAGDGWVAPGRVMCIENVGKTRDWASTLEEVFFV